MFCGLLPGDVLRCDFSNPDRDAQGLIKLMRTGEVEDMYAHGTPRAIDCTMLFMGGKTSRPMARFQVGIALTRYYHGTQFDWYEMLDEDEKPLVNLTRVTLADPMALNEQEREAIVRLAHEEARRWRYVTLRVTEVGTMVPPTPEVKQYTPTPKPPGGWPIPKGLP